MVEFMKKAIFIWGFGKYRNLKYQKCRKILYKKNILRKKLLAKLKFFVYNVDQLLKNFKVFYQPNFKDF